MEICWYIIAITLYYELAIKPSLRKLNTIKVEINYHCCINEMYDLKGNITYGQGKGYKPGFMYFGNAYRTKLHIDHINDANYIDPFYPGYYTDWISINLPSIKYERTYKKKGGLLKYYTDGISTAAIISSGPDKKYENIDYQNKENIFNIVLYDPSNGIYSRGDIIMILNTDKMLPLYGNYDIQFRK